MPLELVRTYNHYWQGAGLFGKHWVSNFDFKLTFGTTALDACFPRPGGGACGIGTNTIIYAWRPDGRTIKYVKQPDGIFYEEKADPIARIEVQPDGSLWHFSEENALEIYSSAGYIVSVRNRHNVRWTFTYTGGTYPTRVTHTSGRYIDFMWTSGQLTSVRDPAGSYYGYAYTANKFGLGLHRLASSAYPGAPATTTTYHYEVTADQTALTGKSFNGQRYSKFTYDANGYATSTEHNGLEKFTFSYTPGANGMLSVIETNPLSKVTNYVFKNGKPTNVTGQPSTYCPTAMYALTEYDANGYPSMRSDFNGNLTSFTYNAKGQLTQQIEGYGTAQARTTQYEWWGPAFGYQIMRVRVLGQSETLYNYDPIGRIASVRITNLSANGVANQSREMSMTYTDYGTMSGGVIQPGMIKTVHVDGMLSGSGDFALARHDALGNLTSEENAVGALRTYSLHNGLGQPGRVTGINGDITDITYDARGRVTRVRTYPDGTNPADTSYTYMPDGWLATATTADGVVTAYEYDTGKRLTRQYRDVPNVLANAGTREEQTYSYNNASQNIATRDWAVEGHYEYKFICRMPIGAPPANCAEPDLEEVWVVGPVQKRADFTDYDELGRVRAYRGNSGQNKRISYDLNGNPTKTTDSQNRVTSLTYDSLNRLTSATDPVYAPAATRIEYDLGNNITKVTDPRGLITTYVYDGFGQLWAQSSPDTGVTTYQYNASGERIALTRNDGSSVAFNYDGLGRLTTATAGASVRSYDYDWCTGGLGRLCGVYAAGSLIHYAYYADGRTSIRREITSANSVSSDYWTHYYYDSIGRLNAITYPNGNAVGYGYLSGKLRTMTLNVGGVVSNIVTGAVYRPYGEITGFTYGNGLVRAIPRDLNNRITSITTKDGAIAIQSRGYNYNVDDNITGVTNNVDPTVSQTYQYDGLYRLTAQTATNANESISYDAGNNRTLYTWAAPIYNTVNPSSNRIDNDYASGSNGITYGHDGRGNRSSQSWGGSTATFVYDGFNRLTSTTRTAVSAYLNPGYQTMTYPAGTSTYAYNAYNERVWKSAPHGSFRYVYGPGNRLISEHQDNGDIWTNYMWFGNELVGFVRNGQVSYLHAEHTGRPEIATNQVKAVVWRAKNYASERGVVTDLIGGINIGFPGQYFDQETGLWYNMNRYYDSRLGRYTQSDSIGLAGGLNTYGYALGNPVRNVDPSGNETPHAGTFAPGSSERASYEAYQRTSRGPDYVQISGSLYVFNGSVTLTRSGNVYTGGGVSRAYPAPSLGVSANAGYVMIDPCLTGEARQREIDNFVNGLSYSVTAHDIVGGGAAYSPSAGTGAALLGFGGGVEVSGGVNTLSTSIPISW